MNHTRSSTRASRALKHAVLPALIAATLLSMGSPPVQAQWELKQLTEGIGEDFQTCLGFSVAGLGDINGDGWPDVGVSVYYKRELRIYYGGPGILDSIPDLVLPGGTSALMADLNGDGFKELCVAKARPVSGPFNSYDTLLIFLGRSGPGLRIDTIPSVVYGVVDQGADFGYYMATGDLNRDGFADLVVSARNDHVLPEPVGSVYVFLGRAVLDSLPDFIGKDWRPDHIAYGQGCWVGDVNGDGYDDLIVGMRHWRVGTVAHGLVSLYFGGPRWVYNASQPDQTIDPSTYGIALDSCGGFETGAVFDANGDGRADYFFTADRSNGNRNYGIFAYGTPTGFSTTMGRTLMPPYNWRYITEGARRIGDINGDGYRDFAFPMAYGQVYYYLGTASGFEETPRATSMQHSVQQWDSYGSGFPQRLDDVGDINGDGADDVILGKYSESPNVAFGYFHVVAGDRRLVGFDPPASVPSSLAVGPAWPNPMHDACAFDVQLATAGPVHVTIHDVLGRTVRTLEQGDLPAGNHTLRWNGRTDEGRAAVSGIYWYHVAAAGGYGNGKLVLN